MKQFWINYLRNNTFFWVFSGIAVALMIASFFMPPMGVIDNSVILASGELFGFAGLGAIIKAIDNGTSAKVRHNNTEISIEKSEK